MPDISAKIHFDRLPPAVPIQDFISTLTASYPMLCPSELASVDNMCISLKATIPTLSFKLILIIARTNSLPFGYSVCMHSNFHKLPVIFARIYSYFSQRC